MSSLKLSYENSAPFSILRLGLLIQCISLKHTDNLNFELWVEIKCRGTYVSNIDVLVHRDTTGSLDQTRCTHCSCHTDCTCQQPECHPPHLMKKITLCVSFIIEQSDDLLLFMQFCCWTQSLEPSWKSPGGQKQPEVHWSRQDWTLLSQLAGQPV